MARTLDWSSVPVRRLDPDRDGPALHAILGDEESCRYLPRPAFASVEETVEQLRKWSVGAQDINWVVTDAADTALARVSLYSTQAEMWEAACMTAPTARGQGYARRGLAQALNHLFATTDARRVCADVDPDNIASARVFEQLGFRLEGRLRATWRTHIGVRDSLIFGLLPSDPHVWPRSPALSPGCPEADI